MLLRHFGNPRRAGRVRTVKEPNPEHDDPAGWVIDQLGVCWYPNERAMEIIRHTVAYLWGCGLCLKRGACGMEEKVCAADLRVARASKLSKQDLEED